MILQTDNLLAGYFHDLLMSFFWKIQWFCVLVAALLTLLDIFTAYGLQIIVSQRYMHGYYEVYVTRATDQHQS